MAKTHNVKCWPEFFEAIRLNLKPFDIRKDDRNHEVGDTLALEEFRPHVGEYTGRKLERRITYIARGEKFEPFGLKPGFSILGLAST